MARSLKEALRHSFNISIAETDAALIWNQATLEVAAVSPSMRYLAGQIAAVEQAATRHATRLGALVTDAYAEILTDSTGDDLELSGDLSNGDDSSFRFPEKL